MIKMLESIILYGAIPVLFKTVVHIALEWLRKDGAKTLHIPGGEGTGGFLLFPIPRHPNKWLNVLIVVSNGMFYTTILCAFILSLLRAAA